MFIIYWDTNVCLPLIYNAQGNHSGHTVVYRWMKNRQKSLFASEYTACNIKHNNYTYLVYKDSFFEELTIDSPNSTNTFQIQ